MIKHNSKKVKKSIADIPVLTVSSFKVTRVRALDSGSVSFDMELNGIYIYGCFVVESEEHGDFIAFPKRKGKDGKYYSIVWAKLSGADSTAILQEVKRLLNE